MMTCLTDATPPAFQYLYQPIHAPTAIFASDQKPLASPGREDFVGQIALCHLDTPLMIEKVQGLRDHINLPSGCRDAQFFEQEKKEINWVLSLPSSFTAS